MDSATIPARWGRCTDELPRRALELGASDAVLLSPAQVVTAEWVRMKCIYGGCALGRCLTCPPFSPAPPRMRHILDEYQAALLLRLDVPAGEVAQWIVWSHRLAALTLDLERELFLAGHYKAFALAGGRPCALAEPCGRPDVCSCRELVRPGPTACGIDVFATSANAGWPLAVVRQAGDPYRLFNLLLVE
jgi:predicted metal-binding protein